MGFGMEGMQQENWSEQNLGFAIQKLQEAPPTFGEGGNTGERDGKYFAMGYELKKEEYDEFFQKLHSLFEEVKNDQENDLKQAA
ncbi:MAG TPA: hypothetical protein VG982_01165 [Candidatus Paceibacterota bacterium]|jgi:hypothetical protein|nr:hypothetical protein [Candidatus Paceibacterota bacterium]